MSEQPTQDVPDPAPNMDSSFDDMFKNVWDVLIPEEAGSETPETPEADTGTPVVPGTPAPEVQGAPTETPGGEEVSTGTPAEPGVLAQPSTTATPVVPALPDKPVDWGAVSMGVEETLVRAHQETALAEVREEHKAYIEALEKHPRLLIGKEVPSLEGEGTETLRDSQDAQEWQEAVKSLLVADINARVQTKMGDKDSSIQPIHDAIAMFQSNPDMVPSYPSFNKELADRFAAAVKPYELRVDGKLMGYNIPVQPIIDVIRQQLSAVPAPAAPAASAKVATPKPPADPPQSGVPSSAPSGAEGTSDFQDSFWSAMGMDGFRV